MEKFVYSFNEGTKNQKTLLGDKGAGLAEMTKLGLPVPFGFTITTEACKSFFDEGEKLSKEIVDQIKEKINELEEVTGRVFGDAENPLLVSVRAGSTCSIPGILNTVLNLGLNKNIIKAAVRDKETCRFYCDCYRRFIKMYGVTVHNIPVESFSLPRVRKWYDTPWEVTAEDIGELINQYTDVIKKETGNFVPEDPFEQLLSVVTSLFKKWKSKDGVNSRHNFGISDNDGMAVTIQTMVYGNRNIRSGSGIAFTRNPLTGENRVSGQFLINAQGEDLINGSRIPRPLSEIAVDFPKLEKQVQVVAKVLEKYYKDVEEIEFTIEDGTLYMLQTRRARLTAFATVKSVVDMVNENIIDKETAILRVDPGDLHNLLHLSFDFSARNDYQLIGEGLPSSPGAAIGKICFNSEDARKARECGEKVILVKYDINPSDFIGVIASEGILSARGGATSYGAMASRNLGKCCVSGCPDIYINEKEGILSIGEYDLKEGDKISIDGITGKIYAGEIKTIPPRFFTEFDTIMKWADSFRTLKVYANVNSPAEIYQAFIMGADGIGLYRTEHMFMNRDHFDMIKKILIAKDENERREAVRNLLPYHREEFMNLYRIAGDKPAIIRIFDYSFYEFFRDNEYNAEKVVDALDLSEAEIVRASNKYRESKTAFGHRGCRLSVLYPEIIEMQIRAIVQAAYAIGKEKNITITPTIVTSLISDLEELKTIRSIAEKVIKEVSEKENLDKPLEYRLGSLIEVPRAALTADKIATEADFFTFGTNDMTQLVYGFAKDDTGDLVKSYLDKGIFKEDPFRIIDEDGVGRLMGFATKLGRQTKPGLKIGICGEQGGDPESISFCHKIGLNHVSCSLYRVPVARLAAARAALINKKEEI